MTNYYLIGARLGHSFSPELHRAFGRYAYQLKELSPEELGPFLASRDFAGLNVTVPYKQAVIPYLDHLDAAARAIGAVNTVVNRAGALWGCNTDFGGMMAALLRLYAAPPLRGGRTPTSKSDPSEGPSAPPVLSGKSVLILGTGGTSKTAQAVCRALGAKDIRRVSRTGREGALTYAEALTEGRGTELLINTTPVGMFPDPDGLPLDPGAFPRLEAVFDCVYNPLRTRLVLEAQSRGIPAAGGLQMLVGQAALTCEAFTGQPVAPEMVDIIYNNLLRARENLVLIGMPGSGKTTVGRLLAKQLGLEFLDTDEEIQRQAGMSVSAIFAREGEPAFRDLETQVIREVSAAGGRVIATGGGAVLRGENVTRLRQNGRIFFLDRPVSQLAVSPERPLADSREKLTALYAQRREAYLAAADEVIADSPTPEEAAARILAALGRDCISQEARIN